MNAPHAKQPAASLEPPRSTARPISAFGRPLSYYLRASTGFSSHGSSRTHTYPRADTHTETRDGEGERETEFPSIRFREARMESKGRRFRKYATHHVQVCPVPLPFPRCIMVRLE